MILRGIKSYLSCLKYIFVPLGALFLGIILGLSIGIPLINMAINGLSDELHNITENLHLDPVALKNSLVHSVSSLDWTAPFDAVKTMLTRAWLENTIFSALNALVDNSDTYITQITTAIDSLIYSIVATILFTLVFAVIFLFAGYFITKSFVRREIAKRSFWKFILVGILDAILTTGVAVLFAWLTSLWLTGGMLFATAFVLINGAIALFEAYFVHANKSIKLKEILNFKNILHLFLTNIVIVALWGILYIIVVALTNTIAGTVIGLALLEIALIVIGMNAEAYVKQEANKYSASNA